MMYMKPWYFQESKEQALVRPNSSSMSLSFLVAFSLLLSNIVFFSLSRPNSFPYALILSLTCCLTWPPVALWDLKLALFATTFCHFASMSLISSFRSWHWFSSSVFLAFSGWVLMGFFFGDFATFLGADFGRRAGYCWGRGMIGGIDAGLGRKTGKCAVDGGPYPGLNTPVAIYSFYYWCNRVKWVVGDYIQLCDWQPASNLALSLLSSLLTTWTWFLTASRTNHLIFAETTLKLESFVLWNLHRLQWVRFSCIDFSNSSWSPILAEFSSTNF